MAEGSEVRAEGSELRAEGSELRAEGSELEAEACTAAGDHHLAFARISQPFFMIYSLAPTVSIDVRHPHPPACKSPPLSFAACRLLGTGEALASVPTAGSSHWNPATGNARLDMCDDLLSRGVHSSRVWVSMWVRACADVNGW